MFAFDQPLGKAIRWPLRRIPSEAVVRVLSGRNRGFRWIVGSGIHSCWLGIYERPISALLASMCRPGMTAFDVGAHAGYFSLLLSRHVGLTGRVVAFEPEQSNLAFLHRHVAINRLANVEIIEAAAAAEPGTMCFDGTGFGGRLSDAGPMLVRTVQLDNYPIPDLIKMDIEGGELAALAGARRIITARRTRWLVETHGTEAECIASFEGYRTRLLGRWLLADPT